MFVFFVQSHPVFSLKSMKALEHEERRSCEEVQEARWKLVTWVLLKVVVGCLLGFVFCCFFWLFFLLFGFCCWFLVHFLCWFLVIGLSYKRLKTGFWPSSILSREYEVFFFIILFGIQLCNV